MFRLSALCHPDPDAAELDATVVMLPCHHGRQRDCRGQSGGGRCNDLTMGDLPKSDQRLVSDLESGAAGTMGSVGREQKTAQKRFLIATA